MAEQQASGGQGRPDGAGADAPAQAVLQPSPGGATAEQRDESVDHPTRLMRIAAMARSMLQEVRQDSLDEAARERLATIHNKSVSALRELVSDELRDELDEVDLLVDTDETPSEPELRIAHAQLVGWLEGLFHGIQASIATQQMAAQEQLRRMRQQGALGSGGNEGSSGPSGQYL